MPPTAASLNRRQWLALAMPVPLLAAGCAARPGTRAPTEVDLVAQPVQAALRGDGHPAVDAWGYGGAVPGPVIRAVQGSRLRVDFHNRLPAATTVHWHGVRVPNAMDGVPHLTQPPVAPGGRFTYEFDLPDAGTFWYHSHLQSAEQVERGLQGVLVVEERQPPAVDRERVWVLDDWRLSRDGRLAGDFGDAHDIAHAGRIGNLVTVNGRLPRDLPVRRGERIRLRLVNAANARIFGLRFDGHAPQVVAIDGHPVAPHAPAGDTVVIAPGMRVDLVLDCIGRPGERHAVGDVFYPRAAYDLLRLAYEDVALREQPLPPFPPIAPNPLPEPDLASATTHALRFEGGMMGRLHGASLDGKPMGMMALMRSGKAWAVNGVVAGGHVHEPALTLERGRSYVLALVNDTRWHHPIHLHGHAFRVLRRNGRPTALREWQDTVLMAPDERVDVALVADNPGDWMLHCHILEHQDGGMMAIVRIR
ncbi:multicopper oxidase family protein [Ramlibacter sp.]|uniref:multicopper oxidase family protein n=1 Tax=Ramlibacter sp. TaxID=1917967 RepID=UPI002FC908D3